MFSPPTLGPRPAHFQYVGELLSVLFGMLRHELLDDLIDSHFATTSVKGGPLPVAFGYALQYRDRIVERGLYTVCKFVHVIVRVIAHRRDAMRIIVRSAERQAIPLA